MKSYLTVFCFLLISLATTFNSIAQVQWPNQSERFYENVKSDNKLRAAESHILYEPTGLDSFISAKMNQYHFPGLQACIVKDDKIIWKGAYGYADIAQNRLVTDSTLFYIASVAKPVTATAIMQLWEQGLFELDDDINNYLPFQVRNPIHPNVPITFRMLLTHTSSIHDNYSQVFVPLFVWGIDSPVPLDSFLVNYLVPGGVYYLSSNYNSVTPGTQWEYSNAGATLIGYLVERISINSFEQYCQDSIFVPLGMNEASWFQANLDTNNIAMPYDYSGNPYGHRGSPTYPAGQLRTSAIQLSRFLRAFIKTGQFENTRILDSATVALMTTVQYPSINPLQGLIWFTPENDLPYVGKRIGVGHDGGSQGASTFMAYGLKTGEKGGAIVLANGRSDEGIREIEWELLAYCILYNKIYAQNVELNSPFMQANEDTLILNTEFVNPNNHNFSANAVISSTEGIVIDSVALYDDGIHGDVQAGDGIWGNYILPIAAEDEFLVGISTTDFDAGGHLMQKDRIRFTTIGPVVIDHFDITSSDTIANPGDRLKFQFTLRNNGSTAAAKNVTSRITALDTFITVVGDVEPSYGDISSGEMVTGDLKQYIRFLNTSYPKNPYETRIAIDIRSDGYSFWRDTTSIMVGLKDQQNKVPVKFSLFQNYPNPFNPITVIRYQLPAFSKVKLSIYNILGQKVQTLVSKKQPAGTYIAAWDASGFASGVYLYRLETDKNFVKTRKLVLLK